MIDEESEESVWSDTDEEEAVSMTVEKIQEWKNMASDGAIYADQLLEDNFEVEDEQL